MDANIKKYTITSVKECFSSLKDPRVEGRTKHQLIDIIVLSICAIVCGAETWTAIEAFGHAKYNWLKTIIDLDNGVPSDQTISRVFSLIPAREFMECFKLWVNWSSRKKEGEIVAIDGKTLRRSHHKRLGKDAIHLVNAFATENGIVIGHEKTQEKSNEIKAIPPLLKQLELEGCIVTMDAMGCQKGIANLIRLRGADYVLAVKGNQGRLHKKIKNLFEKARENEYEAMVYKEKREIEGDHGRVEDRTYTLLPLMYLFAFKKYWKDLQILIQVENRIYKNGEEKVVKRYFISSLPWAKAPKVVEAIRKHWHVENKLHWCLDVVFHEDSCRIRKGYADQNFAILRQLVLNMLRRDTSLKGGLQIKRSYAAWNNRYLRQVIGL